MSWDRHHSASEKLAIDAQTAIRSGDITRAVDLYKRAAVEETAALDALERGKHRTRGITSVSASALWYKAHEYNTAEQLAHLSLADGNLPPFAQSQLRNLLQAIWTAAAAEKAGVKFVTGDVFVSVKGGQVIHGGAPLDLIMQKVEGIQSVLFRTVELLLSRPFRRRGGPPADLQSMFRPWLFQAPAGSYQFAVRMQEPEQGQLFEADRPKVERVTTTFFSILRATINDPDVGLAVLVSDAEYRGAFVRLSRNLAPTGKTFDRLEVSDAGAPAGGPGYLWLGHTTRAERYSAKDETSGAIDRRSHHAQRHTSCRPSRPRLAGGGRVEIRRGTKTCSNRRSWGRIG